MTIQETAVKPGVRDIARGLAAANAEAEPDIITIHSFQSVDQVWLVEVDTTVAPHGPGERIPPFYFGAARGSGIPYPSAVALIAPDDDGRAALPPGWGDWRDAEALWSRS